MPEAFRAFISHSNVDRKTAVRVKKYLERLGVEVFMAHEDVGSRRDGDTVFLEELQDAGFLVAVVSKHFNRSVWAPQEVAIAVARGILIIPLCVDSTLPSGFIEELQGKRLPRQIPPDFLTPPIGSQFPRELRNL
jgi:hypothetical protein